MVLARHLGSPGGHDDLAREVPVCGNGLLHPSLTAEEANGQRELLRNIPLSLVTKGLGLRPLPGTGSRAFGPERAASPLIFPWSTSSPQGTPQSRWLATGRNVEVWGHSSSLARPALPLLAGGCNRNRTASQQRGKQRRMAVPTSLPPPFPLPTSLRDRLAHSTHKNKSLQTQKKSHPTHTSAHAFMNHSGEWVPGTSHAVPLWLFSAPFFSSTCQSGTGIAHLWLPSAPPLPA